MNWIEKLKQGFKSKKLSSVTQKRWLYIANDFLDFLKQKNISVTQVTPQTIRDYLGYKSKKMNSNALKTTYYALKSIFKIWGNKQLFEELEDDIPRGYEPERPFFTLEETKKIIKSAKERYKQRKDWIGLRDLVMILISAETGTRRIQLQRLNRENFTKEKTLKIPPSFKGGSWTTRKLRKETIKYIEEYLKKREERLDVFANKPDSPLFIDKSNKRISPEAMGWIFGEIKKQAGITKSGQFHGFRRGKTTRLAKGGMSEIEITKVMGWKEGSKEPHIYAQLDQNEIQDKAYKVDELMEDEEI